MHFVATKIIYRIYSTLKKKFLIYYSRWPISWRRKKMYSFRYILFILKSNLYKILFFLFQTFYWFYKIFLQYIIGSGDWWGIWWGCSGMTLSASVRPCSLMVPAPADLSSMKELPHGYWWRALLLTSGCAGAAYVLIVSAPFCLAVAAAAMGLYYIRRVMYFPSRPCAVIQ